MSVRGASSNSSTAKVAIYVGGTKIGNINFTGTTPTTQNISFTGSAGVREIKFVMEEDTGAWDAFLDFYEISN